MLPPSPGAPHGVTAGENQPDCTGDITMLETLLPPTSHPAGVPKPRPCTSKSSRKPHCQSPEKSIKTHRTDVAALFTRRISAILSLETQHTRTDLSQPYKHQRAQKYLHPVFLHPFNWQAFLEPLRGQRGSGAALRGAVVSSPRIESSEKNKVSFLSCLMTLCPSFVPCIYHWPAA